MSKKMLLLDGNSLMYRAYYATAFSGKVMRNSKDFPINCLLTMTNIVNRIIKVYKPDYILSAFDAGSKTLRHDKLESYKAGRTKTPQELIQQIPHVKEMMNYMGIYTYEQHLIEADDIIGTLAKKAGKEGFDVHCFSSDKDLFQLADENITVQWVRNGGVIDPITPEEFAVKYDGLTPSQIIDLKAIEGDASDNLPGIKGIGQKTGIKLLQKYGTFEAILENLEELSPGQRAKFEEHQEMGKICKDIATIMIDLDLPIQLPELKFHGQDVEELWNFYQKFELWQLQKRLPPRPEEVESIPSDLPPPREPEQGSLF